MSSTLWLVGQWWSGFTVLADPCTLVHGARGVDSSSCVSTLGIGVLGGQCFFTFVHLFPFPLSSSPRVWSPGPCSSPREEKQGVVASRAVTTLSLLLETMPFIGPNSLSLDNYISRNQYVTSGAGLLVPSYIHFQH